MRNILILILLCLSLLTLFAESGTPPSKVSSPRIEPAEPLPAPVPVIIDRNEPKEGTPVLIPEPTVYRPVLIDRNEPKIADAEPTPFSVPPELMPQIRDRNKPKETVTENGGRPPAFDPDMYEPDNSATQYTALSVYSYEQSEGHTFHVDGDQDWFRFQGVPGRIYTFNSIGASDTRIFLYADDGVTYLDGDDDDGEGNNFFLQFAPTTNAFYKLKVDNYFNIQGSYNFYYSFGAALDIYEPDNSADQTTLIDICPALASQNHTLHSNIDQDWFLFYGYTGRIYTFESSGTTDTRIYLYQDDGITQLGFDDDDGSESNFYLEFIPPANAFYKVQIVPYSGSGGVYIFHYSYGANPDSYEPDDSAADYTITTVYSYELVQSHTLHNTTDQDWYRFYATAGNVYKFSSTGNTDVRVYLYNDSGTTILAEDDDSGEGYNFSLSHQLFTSGYYKLKVVGFGAAVGAYDLHYLWELISDYYEPDNSADEATSIAPTWVFQNQDHNLHNTTDEDWFVFQGVPGRLYTFYSSGQTDNVVYIYEEDGTTQLAMDDDSGADMNFYLQFWPSVSGTYKLKVCVYHTWSPIGQYYFHFNQSSVPDAYEPDESVADPTALTVLANLQTQDHTLHTDIDEDWYRFQGLAGRTYHFYSTSGTDTQIYLYADNGTTQLDWDDDSWGFPAFFLVFTPTATAYYTLKVIGSGGDVGAYDFKYYYSIGLDVPQNVAITRSGGNVTVSWTAVPGAWSYVIEVSSDPYTGFSPIFMTVSNYHTEPATEARLFYRIRASEYLP